MSGKHYKPFPTHAFYNCIRLALEEVRANLQAPDALIAGAFLTALSTCAAGDINVLQPTGQKTPPVFNNGSIADSGERKTGTDKTVLAVLYALDAKYAVEYQKALIQYKADIRYWTVVDKAIQHKLAKAIGKGNAKDIEQLRCELHDHIAAEPSKPKRYRIVYQSITERPLMEALQGDDKCIAIMSDEGSTVLNGIATNSLATLNKAWDGPALMTFDRADESIEARNPRVTVSFMIQQKLFEDFMEKRGEIARQSGFLARFLVCWPASTQGYRYMSLDEPIWEHLPKFHARMKELLEATTARRKAGDTSRKLLSFSPEAKSLWALKQNTIEPHLQQGGELESVRDFVSKSMEIAGRLAACMHHFEGLAGDVINMETLQRALDVLQFYFEEYKDLFGNHQLVPQLEKDTRTLGLYLHARYWVQGYPSALRNEVRKSGPIRHQARYEGALAELCRVGSVIVSREDVSKGKSRLWIRMNPGVFNNIVQ
jgi:hypothetical protein